MNHNCKATKKLNVATTDDDDNDGKTTPKSIIGSHIGQKPI